MRLYAVKTRLVQIGDNLSELVIESLRENGLELENDDIIAITSKIVAHAEGRLARLSDIKPSDKAKEIAKQFSMQPEFAELILREAERIYGGVDKAILTLKNNVLAANAGIDNKNAPQDHVVLWPSNPQKCAAQLRNEIKRKTGKCVAILVVDSGLIPLRKGTVGLALAVAGFKPIADCRGKDDIYGKKITITQNAVADNLASAAHLLMGEATEKTPIVLIKDAPVEFDDNTYGSEDMLMPSKECIFMNTSLKHSHDSEQT